MSKFGGQGEDSAPPDSQLVPASAPNALGAECDMPFLFTQRYSISPDFENSDVLAKRQVDVQGALDMQYSLKQWQKGNV